MDDGSAAPYPDMDLLRLTTAGSVDDGKSTLIGRLLHDTKSIFADQMEHIEGASRRRGETEVDLALLTDGLRAEREQRITIDVAYRYFATPRRKFIIADTPGHVQYTRNMVTGASTAELAIVLVDARRGVLTQSKRHAFIASLLGIPHLIVAVNKMDLVDYAEDVYEAIRREFTSFSRKLTVQDISFIPISALRGDNVASWSDRMPWYGGGSLLHRLETVNVGSRQNEIDFRFPVQCVIRPGHTFRGYAGTVASGSVSPGEEILVLPSRQLSRVDSIRTLDGEREEARAGDAVVITVEDDLDISRGDMIVRRRNVPSIADRLEAYLCWMGDEPLVVGRPYVLFHTTRQVQAWVESIEYRVDVDTLHRESAATLHMNEIGRVGLATSSPLYFDSYRVNVRTGCFVLVDATSNVTVAAGMVRGGAPPTEETAGKGAEAETVPSGERPVSKDVVWEGWNVPREEREATTGHRAAVVWFTGLPGAGKTTIARGVERRLFESGVRTMLLDGDQVRHGLCGDLGFTPADRDENIRRVGEVARLFFEQGSVVLCAFVSPYAAGRDAARRLLPPGRFVEVHVHAALAELRRRDPKGLYRRQESGELKGLTGVSAPYEPPREPELDLDTTGMDVDQAIEAVLRLLKELGII